MSWPEDGQVAIKSLASRSPYCSNEISGVELLGSGKFTYTHDVEALKVLLPEKKDSKMPLVLKISNIK